ncbi:hypothetical protein D915_006906 [Fasciola hepatica]|uniref:Uncharacterized protein n=1 Tax=Fasciola hepatica TaxID=6192 RepID=A0A4E0RW63_FASHE|nr:hypothetical protein D915_006906 [Fasciola hepatica]
MAFKIPRLSFTRKLPDDRCFEEPSFVGTRGGFEEKTSSSQLTNSSLFSRGEFEDSQSQSQPDDSQCFWKSLRKLWKPEDDSPVNECGHSPQSADIESQSQMLDEIILLIEEINILVKSAEKERATDETVELKQRDICDINDSIMMMRNWVNEQLETMKENENVMKKIEESQIELEALIKNLFETLERLIHLIIYLFSQRFQVCTKTARLINQNEVLCKNRLHKSVLESPWRITQLRTRKALVNTLPSGNVSFWKKHLQNPKSSPNQKSGIIRLTFKSTPLSEKRKRNLRSSLACRRIMRSTTIETETVWKPITSQMTIQKTEINSEQTSCRNLMHFFTPPSPDNDDGDSLSLSSISDI